MASWASNGSMDGDVVIVSDPSPVAPMADCVVTPPMGVGLLSLYPGIMGDI